MKLKVQAQHLQPGDIVGSGEEISAITHSSTKFASNKVLVYLDKNGKLNRSEALFMAAASCQGGHSHAGRAIAELLSVPFPLRMESLRAKALTEGLDPKKLWPWHPISPPKNVRDDWTGLQRA